MSNRSHLQQNLRLPMQNQITIQIIKDRLYYFSSHKIPQNIPNASYFNIDDILQYNSFHQDFGPLNLACIYKYIQSLQELLNSQDKKEEIFYHHTSTNFKKRANSALLICCYQMIKMNKNAYDSYFPFKDFTFRPFRDATSGPCKYECTILDCLLGLQYAIKLGWFNYETFDLEKYEYYEQVQNGDLSEIISEKLYAFSSPSDRPKDFYGNKLLQCQDYIKLLKKLEIDAVVRLSENTYKQAQFQKHKISHYDFPFPQATAPPMSIVRNFFQAVEKHQKIGVHCKAGLGKTCTLIGCFAIKHYKFNAAHFIGWSRLCRPGSILGPQQYFLVEYEELLMKSGEGSPLRKRVEEQLESQMSKSEKQESKGSCQEEDFLFSSLEIPKKSKEKSFANEEQKTRELVQPMSATLSDKKSKLLRKKTFGMQRFNEYKLKE